MFGDDGSGEEGGGLTRKGEISSKGKSENGDCGVGLLYGGEPKMFGDDGTSGEGDGLTGE